MIKKETGPEWRFILLDSDRSFHWGSEVKVDGEFHCVGTYQGYYQRGETWGDAAHRLIARRPPPAGYRYVLDRRNGFKPWKPALRSRL